jgi:hypothetical protein
MGGVIWQLMTKSGEAKKTFLQETLRRRSPAATPLIREKMDLSFVRSVSGALDTGAFFGSLMKDREVTNQKGSGHLIDGRSQPERPLSLAVQEFFCWG